MGAAGSYWVSGEEGDRSAADLGARTVPFHGRHQAGIDTPPQAHGLFLGLDLREGIDLERWAGVMRILTDDAARLTQGRPPLADTEPQLAQLPANLTVTFGFGPGLFHKLGVAEAMPDNFASLPSYEIDELDPAWSGGDLLVQICSDDLLALTHAQRMLVKDSRAILWVVWAQRGYRNASGVSDERTQRNVMGQLDGTANPVPDGGEFDETVWAAGSGWFSGGTTLALRRIRVAMETWDRLDDGSKEMHIGRTLDNGAPLTGERESDAPDLDATEGGIPVIHRNAHIRRATPADGRRILRRSYNYDSGPTADGDSDTGLLFASYQADLSQFTAIQDRLAESDLLNAYTTPVGSAVFAIPPGCEEGGWIGEGLVDL